MCLAVPARIVSIDGADSVTRMGKVDFGGVIREVCLAYVPEAKPGDYVIVHVGFALSVMDQDEAQKTLEDLREMDRLASAEVPGTAVAHVKLDGAST